jgi:glutathione S-transferase
MGEKFCLVDAVFGPVFRYFDIFDKIDHFGFFDGLPKIKVWRSHLQNRSSVREAVRLDYPELLQQFLIKRDSALSRRILHSA